MLMLQNEQTFRALDELVTLLRLLELFFMMCQLILFCATSSCTVEKASINFEITDEKMRLFLSTLLLTGYHKLPDLKMYWEATPGTFVKARSDSMLRNTFEHVLQNLNLCDNKQLDE